jgi:pyruvate ferredoxin oxidoreductase beta subunit
MGIVAAHNLAYAATCSLAFLEDFRDKVQKAKSVHGFRLLMVDGPCPPGHKTEPAQSIHVARMAVETRLFPLFEVERQHYAISYKPERFRPAVECLRLQGRFRPLFQPGNEQALDDVQAHVEEYWARLEKLEES